MRRVAILKIVRPDYRRVLPMRKQLCCMILAMFAVAFAFVSCGGGGNNNNGGGQTVSVTGVSLNKNTMALTDGSSETLTQTITPSNATNKGVTWTSSNDAIASVSGGRVTGVAQGAATITVRTNDGGHTATCAVTVIGSATGTPDTSWYNSASTTFTIYNADQLAGLAALVNNGNTFSGKTIILGNNIDLSAYASGEGWTPIGNSSSITFAGDFNGDGKTISNLTINGTSDYIGLFGYVRYGKIQNLGIVNASINGGHNYGDVGGIAGWVSNSSITNCYSTGAVSGGGSYASVGGIAGQVSNSSITNCYSTATVSSSGDVGGIAGWVSNSSITNCYSTGTVSGKLSVGGIAGIVTTSNSSIMGCAALNVTGSSNLHIGGRVVASIVDIESTLSNNIAWSGMLVNGVTVSGTAIDKNGADKTAAEIQNGSAFNGMFTDSVWTKQNGYLPGLFGQPVPIPAHIN